MHIAGVLIVALLIVVCSAHEHHHDHDHDHHDHHEHDHHHDHEHGEHRQGAQIESQSDLFDHIYAVVEWALIGGIVVLAILVVKMILSPPKAVPAVYKEARKPPKVFLTREELRSFDGSDPSRPIYVAIGRNIFDVSSRRDLYGIKGQAYNVLAGYDASRAFAKHALDAATVQNHDVSDLTEGEKEALHSWEVSYLQKYTVAGEIVTSLEEKNAKMEEERKRYDLETKRLQEESKPKL